VKRKEMNFVSVVERAQLDAGNHAHSETLTGSSRFMDPVDGVVIGQSDRSESAALCLLDYALGSKNAVRSG